jgi:hypothetical protein
MCCYSKLFKKVELIMMFLAGFLLGIIVGYLIVSAIISINIKR